MKAVILDIRRVLAVTRVSLKYGAKPLLLWVLNLSGPTPILGVRLRLAFEELGLVYLKFGQFLSMRFDILPVEVCHELNKLFEAVSPLSFEEVRQVIESELKGPVNQFFPVFKQEPIAAASVAQVHEAYTCAQEKVAVKIQRPGVEDQFAADMRNLRRLAAVVDALGIVGTFSAREVADQFATWTQREMDFVTEGRTAERLRKNAAAYEIVPRIHWKLTTRRVLTMEFIEGTSLAKVGEWIDAGRIDLLATRLPHLNIERAGRNIAFAVMRQLFLFGFFQGDPNPGNVFVRDDNTVAFVDFGIFGELTREQRENFAGFLENLALGNIEQSFRYYAKQHTPTADTDLKAFEREGMSILYQWHKVSINSRATAKERHMGKYAEQMIDTVRRHRLTTNPEMLLLWRALYALDASSERLSTLFDMMGQVRSFFAQIRPGPVARVTKILTDPRRRATAARLVQFAAPQLARVMSDIASHQVQSQISIAESENSRRSYNRELWCLIQSVLGISLAATALSPSIDGTVRVVLCSGAAGLLLWPLIRVRTL